MRAAARATIASALAAGAGAALALGALDGVVAASRGAPAVRAVMAAAASASLLALLGLAIGGLAGALLAVVGGLPLRDRLAALWTAPAGERSGTLAGLVAGTGTFVVVHRVVLGAADEVVRSDRFRAVAALAVGLGALVLAVPIGAIVARLAPWRRVRARTILLALGLAGAAALGAPFGLAPGFAEALGLPAFLLAPIGLAGAVTGLWLSGHRHRRRVGAIVAALLVLGLGTLALPSVRATIAWGTVSARCVQALLPVGDAAVVRAEPAPPPFAPRAPARMVARRPVVLVSLDAVGARHLGLHGARRPTSSFLDRWAAGGVVFDAAMATGPMTRLSVPALFVGLAPSQVAMTRRTGVTNQQRLADTTLAERLAAAGYHTVAVPGGRYFVGFRGMTQGFVEVDRTAADRTRETDTRGAIVTTRALAALEAARTRAAPTFLWVHYDDAHAPHSAIDGAPAFGDRGRDRYEQEIWWVDRQLERLLPAIDRALGDRDPLVVLTADHGERFDRAGNAIDRNEALEHGTLWVPLVVRLAGVRPHRVRGAVSLLDLCPTILDLVGLHPRARFEGRSLVPELLGARDDRARIVYAELDRAGPAVLESIAARKGRRLLLADRVRGVQRAVDLGPDGRAERETDPPPELVQALEAHAARLERPQWLGAPQK